ncbi:DeoR/GlpR family DNA-binding transcription regulator [Microbacterium sp.]|uniref:DeoR/GlpR family DNA-binding transcription regulator n=1 Tax=Microbacterium sp. TaxID=51671 RepID=UPI003A9074E0
MSDSVAVDGGADARDPNTVTNKAARLAYVTNLVNQEGFVGVDALADELGVSRMTIHRDLDELQRLRVLRKVRGGASAHRSTQFESDLLFRARSSVHEKRQIAAAAAELISEGDVILLDDSTTTLEVVPFLENYAPLTVITNFMQAMQKLTSAPEINLIALGGEYESRYQAFLGMICERTLADLHADILFASSSALRGTDVYHQDQSVVTAKHAMIRAAEKRVLLIDSSKIGQSALHRVCSVTDFTHVVLDDQADEGTRRLIEETGVQLIIA